MDIQFVCDDLACRMAEKENKLNVAKMIILHWMSGHTRQDRIRNKCTKNKVGVVPIVKKEGRISP